MERKKEEEVNKESILNAHARILEVIKSCKTDEQLDGAMRMSLTFRKTYGQSRYFDELVEAVYSKSVFIK